MKYSIILILILTGCSNKFQLSHISEEIDKEYIYSFRNKKGIEITIIDSIGKFHYGDKGYSQNELRLLSK